MGKIRIVILKDTRPNPKWSFPRRAVAVALGCKPADPRVAAVRDEALVALATFRKTEHWHDRVSLIQRVRALGVIRRALGVAEDQHSQLDPYTRSWLSRDDFRFGQRILELRQALDIYGYRTGWSRHNCR